MQLSLFEKQKSTDWKWTMEDDYPKEKNGLKVFSCFACGGGSGAMLRIPFLWKLCNRKFS